MIYVEISSELTKILIISVIKKISLRDCDRQGMWFIHMGYNISYEAISYQLIVENGLKFDEAILIL